MEPRNEPSVEDMDGVLQKRFREIATQLFNVLKDPGFDSSDPMVDGLKIGALPKIAAYLAYRNAERELQILDRQEAVQANQLTVSKSLDAATQLLLKESQRLTRLTIVLVGLTGVLSILTVVLAIPVLRDLFWGNC